MNTFIIKNEEDLEKHKDQDRYYIPGDAVFQYPVDTTRSLRVEGGFFVENEHSITVRDIRAGRFISVGGDIESSGFIKAGWSISGRNIRAGRFINSGGGIRAGGDISGWDIKAGDSINSGGGVKAIGYIESQGSILVEGSISARRFINTKIFIESGGDISAGERYGISAGLSITCRGTLTFGLKAFAGICTWKQVTEDEKTITCAKLEGGGVVAHGILIETGIDRDQEECGEEGTT